MRRLTELRSPSLGLTKGLAGLLLWAGSAAYAEDALNTGDTAWMLTSTALVLFMTIPGLALFYAGLVRSKNVLSVLMQCFGTTALVTVLWVVYGYSLAFDTGGMAEGVKNLHSFVGGGGALFLRHLGVDTLHGSIPESVFIMYQMTFAIITPALICGAYAERMKYSAVLLFTAFWLTLVYAPLCHMAWGGPGSLFGDWKVLDFAGGTVVHINAGIAALVACVILGPRRGYPHTPMPPHDLTMAVTGAGMLWVGWFGFNAGSAVAANGSAGMAMLVTQISAGTATLTWMGIEWFKHGKPSALGAVTGAVAGLGAITPASGSCGPMGALIIGFLAAVCCFVGATTLKRRLGYDDSLDTFGVHGVGGLVGTLLAGIVCAPLLGGHDMPHGSIGAQFAHQAMGCGVTLAYSGLVSFAILKGLDVTLGLRVSPDVESEGLDLAQHGEAGYTL
jgi:Amt family ammonium transporter